MQSNSRLFEVIQGNARYFSVNQERSRYVMVMHEIQANSRKSKVIEGKLW